MDKIPKHIARRLAYNRQTRRFGIVSFVRIVTTENLEFLRRDIVLRRSTASDLYNTQTYSIRGY